MKLKKSGQVLLALVVSLGLCFGLTSCVNDYTVAYLYVTGAYQNQIGAFKVGNNTGNLTVIGGAPFGSNGVNPIRMLVSSTGRYLYVLNAGKPTTDSSGNITYQSANISVFSVGGNGILAFQQSYTSQGFGSTRFGLTSNGSFLYVMDQYSPAAGGKTGSTTLLPGMQCQDSSGIYHPTGDVTAFTVDNSTGRLSLITNNQLQNPDGTSLSYFPVGCQPIDMKVTGGDVFVADTYDPNAPGNRNTIFPYALSLTTGQLTTTQNTEFVTGASSISTIGTDAATKYLYVLDPANDLIWYYTIGANGLLQAVNGSPTSNGGSAGSQAGNPIAVTSDSKSKFLYVANAGPSTSLGQANSDITGYTIAANGVLANVSGSPFVTGSGPQCILEDPSNQYLYTADYNTSTVSSFVLDPNSGVLTKTRNQVSYPTVNNPTWCVADGHTD